MYKLLGVCFSFLFFASTAYANMVDVQFVDSKKFVDFKAGENDWLDFEETALGHFQRHITKLAQALPEGSKLIINISNIDLAGRLKWKGHDRIRFFEHKYSPAIAFDYQLIEGDKFLAQGNASLRNTAFLSNSNSRDKFKALGYEKRLFTKWFDATLKSFEVEK